MHTHSNQVWRPDPGSPDGLSNSTSPSLEGDLDSSGVNDGAAAPAAAFCAEPGPSPSQVAQNSQREVRDRERLLRIGRATDTLIRELPVFFQEGIITEGIYAPGIRFYEPHFTRSHVRGLGTYKRICWLLVKLTTLCYRDTKFSIIPCGQLSSADVLRIKWCFEATPRVLGPQRFEGYSLYSFDETGLISEHRIEAVTPPPSKLFSAFSVFHLVHWWQGNTQTQTHTHAQTQSQTTARWPSEPGDKDR